jgi:hypothetical protein
MFRLVNSHKEICKEFSLFQSEVIIGRLRAMLIISNLRQLNKYFSLVQLVRLSFESNNKETN